MDGLPGLHQVGTATAQRSGEPRSPPYAARSMWRMHLPAHYIKRSDDIEAVWNYLQQPDKRIVALSGMGGIGKTTLARAVFNEASCSVEFDQVVWITVGKKPNREELLKEIWREVKGSQDVPHGHIDDSYQRFLHTLKTRCTLLVLDDVWDAADVEKLLVTDSNEQSKVLMTTRNARVPRELGTNSAIFDVPMLDRKASEELFCRRMFGVGQVPGNKQRWAHLVHNMVALCGQLPLALSTISSMAAGYTREEEWQSGLRKLKQPSKQVDHYAGVLKALRTSYDALDDDQKLMITCLVCYADGCHVKAADLVEHWMALKDGLTDGFDGNEICQDGFAVLGELQDRSMINIDQRPGEQLRYAGCHMHSLIRDIAMAAANNERPALSVEDKDKVALCCTLPIPTQPRDLAASAHSLILREHQMQMFSALVVKFWTNLKVLDLSGHHLEKVSKTVGGLTTLEVLRLDHCSVKALPEEIVNLQRLAVLSLRTCRLLTHLPQRLGKLTRLHSLYLEDCSALKSVPQSLVQLVNLRNLDVARCKSLLTLPEGLWDLCRVTYLNLRGCLKLTMHGLSHPAHPVLLDMVMSMSELQCLDLSGLPRLTEIPASIGNLGSLTRLDLSGCSKLSNIPEAIGGASRLGSLSLAGCNCLNSIPDEIGELVLLEYLDLSNCYGLVHIPASIGCLSALQRLELSDCRSLIMLPDSIRLLSELFTLDLRGCCNLSKVPEAIEALRQLRFLSLNGCSRVSHIPKAIWSLKHLQHLDLSGCFQAHAPNCVSDCPIPDAIGSLGELHTLILNSCSSLVRIPASVGQLNRLHTLLLSGCRNLESIPEEVSLLSRLKTLDLSCCTSLRGIPEGIKACVRLRTLNLTGCSGLASLPDISLLEQLRGLFVGECTGLGLGSLPRSLGSLSHLHVLELRGCPKLRDFEGGSEWIKCLHLLETRGCCILRQGEEASSTSEASNLRGFRSLVDMRSTVFGSKRGPFLGMVLSMSKSRCRPRMTLAKKLHCDEKWLHSPIGHKSPQNTPPSTDAGCSNSAQATEQ
ncbi:unnamed protein product [Ostreobium quekettii]|uniref:AAA+ ATPase domain-containing protein n=1 Tax=Ostreobium quekettii TaxID=121088 RepID=A0A8S1IRP6_9CHLO|nr:unnamed protein product [Ostreobium quekettii]|eukprot:evm.model.scf_1887.1 EVM.evm.TU.scf_1887.1   scf_1887:11438-16848(+)